ncbi:MAG: RnfABCDGE type electron transport complex subunit D [Oscillospiraceae bacterium]|nr:RnfABCDGE type electron transport complex subunit D [Oscillospiraceae bacterium]
MEKNKLFTVSASPHISSRETVPGIMRDVLISLSPALAAAVLIFGFRSLLVTAVCVISCILSEYLSRKAMKRKNTVSDLSATVTGLLLAFNLPVDMPLWMAAVGSVFAIVVVKQFFGGLGNNFVNPAIGGRIMLLVCFPVAMSTWALPMAWRTKPDVTTGATLLYKLSGMDMSGDIAEGMGAAGLPSMFDMLIGRRGGSLGEACTIALILGGVYLIARKIIKPVIPLSFIGTVAVIMLFAGKFDLDFLGYQIMGGGLILGAVFMATDYVTCPSTNKGKLVFGIGCGVITAVIRLYGSLPEGVSYSIIIMNILTPLIDRVTALKPFGFVKEKAEKEAKA